MGWLITCALSGLASSPAPAQVIYSGAGLNAAGILVPLNNFQSDLGTLNPNVAGSFGSGRREINWDGVPDSFSAPNSLPANFFNSNSPRGVTFTTPGTGFQVSADSSNTSSTPVQFGDINATYPSVFEPFSAERLFTAVGSNILDVNFFLPGSATPALSRGFGSVFSDVDVANSTSLQFFDAANNSLGTFFAPNIAGDETFSFLGVSFPTPIVSRVRITSGNQALSPGNTASDLVVMDDFVYGEPTLASVPEAGHSIILLTLSLLGLFAVQRLTRGVKVG